MRSRKVGFLLLEGYSLMSVAAAVEPLRAVNLLSGQTVYAMSFLSLLGTPARSSIGANFDTVSISDAGTDFDIVFVVAGGNLFGLSVPQLGAWLWRLDRAGVGLGGISGGAAILYAAGLLAERRFTLHWHYQAAFQERFPDALIERRIYVVDRNRYTCAGGIAPLDMMYAMIMTDQGAAFAREVTDWYLHTEIRSAQHPQRAGSAEKYGVHHPVLIKAIDLMNSHIADPLEASQLADLCGMSARHLHRIFKNSLQKPIGVFYTEVRIEKAKELLSQTALPILDVAIATGYSNLSHFTRTFGKVTGATPAVFRARA